MDLLRPRGESSHISYQLYRNYRDEEPKTLKETQDFIDVLIEKKMKIQAQLSDKNKTFDDGTTRLRVKDYHKWRTKRVKEIINIEILLRDLKNIKVELKNKEHGLKFENHDDVLESIQEDLKIIQEKIYALKDKISYEKKRRGEG